MKHTLLFSLILLGLAGCGTASPGESPATVNTTNTDIAVLETSPATACTADTDCYCRSFNGAEFVEGETAPSICCVEVDGSRCPQVNYCQQCTYR